VDSTFAETSKYPMDRYLAFRESNEGEDKETRPLLLIVERIEATEDAEFLHPRRTELATVRYIMAYQLEY
jgi:hypothetical protein